MQKGIFQNNVLIMSILYYVFITLMLKLYVVYQLGSL